MYQGTDFEEFVVGWRLVGVGGWLGGCTWRAAVYTRTRARTHTHTHTHTHTQQTLEDVEAELREKDDLLRYVEKV